MPPVWVVRADFGKKGLWWALGVPRLGLWGANRGNNNGRSITERDIGVIGRMF